MTIALITSGLVSGFMLGDTRRGNVFRRWLLRNAWALDRRGWVAEAEMVRRLANGIAVECKHGNDAGSCHSCIRERAKRREEIVP